MHLVRIADPSMRLTADYQYKQAARGSDGALAAAARGPALAFPGRARFDPTDARWAPSARKLTGDAGRCPPWHLEAWPEVFRQLRGDRSSRRADFRGPFSSTARLKAKDRSGSGVPK